MKKIFLIIILLFSFSCQEVLNGMVCGRPPQYEIDKAKWYFSNTRIERIYLKDEEIKEKFGCYYYFGDWIYSFSSLFEGGYILVRNGEAVYYIKN